ncbi:hypothetical protein LQZ18_05820 [Lachnospiraceae bacterium ZAX-1]
MEQGNHSTKEAKKKQITEKGISQVKVGTTFNFSLFSVFLYFLLTTIGISTD